MAQRIAAAASTPARVISFGSYARGEAREDSDLDLLVVEKAIDDYTQEYLRLRDAAGQVGVGIDLLSLSETEFEKKKLGGPRPSTGPCVKAGRCMNPHDWVREMLR